MSETRKEQRMKPACEMTVDSPVPSPDPQRCGGIDYPLVATVAFESTTHRCQVASVYDREDIAEFIVRAVNSHDELVAACRDAVKMLESPKFQEWIAAHRTDDEFYAMASAMDQRCDTLRQSIAHATGQEIPVPAISENLNQPL